MNDNRYVSVAGDLFSEFIAKHAARIAPGKINRFVCDVAAARTRIADAIEHEYEQLCLIWGDGSEPPMGVIKAEAVE